MGASAGTGPPRSASARLRPDSREPSGGARPARSRRVGNRSTRPTGSARRVPGSMPGPRRSRVLAAWSRRRRSRAGSHRAHPAPRRDQKVTTNRRVGLRRLVRIVRLVEVDPREAPTVPRLLEPGDRLRNRELPRLLRGAQERRGVRVRLEVGRVEVEAARQPGVGADHDRRDEGRRAEPVVPEQLGQQRHVGEHSRRGVVSDPMLRRKQTGEDRHVGGARQRHVGRHLLGQRATAGGVSCPPQPDARQTTPPTASTEARAGTRQGTSRRPHCSGERWSYSWPLRPVQRRSHRRRRSHSARRAQERNRCQSTTARAHSGRSCFVRRHSTSWFR